MRAFLAAAVLAAVGAQAEGIPQTVDLDKPGALATLERERPADYRAVIERVSRAERMNCAPAAGLLRAQRPPGHERCRAYLIGTSYPARVHLFIPLGGSRYVITAYVDSSADRLSPAR